ncbi:MAG: hypothetical protein ABI871_02030 [Chthoniobacterales bacterium]
MVDLVSSRDDIRPVVEARTLRGEAAGALVAGSAVVALSSVLLWRDPLLFWNDDYELSILPVFADVARSWSEGHLPLLSPYSWICGNLAGEFQYGTFSAFVNAAVVLIWKFPLTFSQQAAALSMTHLFALGAGGYLLARGRNLSGPLSTMVALVAAANGWIVCWGATNWFGALGAFTWLPWAWWGLERAFDVRRGPYRYLWPAPFVYLLITGGFPYTVLMLGVLTGWLALKSLGETRRFSSIMPPAVGTLLGVGLSSPAWLSLFDYLRGSARQVQEAAEHFQWVVPPAALPGFILPSWTVNWADFSTRLMPHTGVELACGLVPPAALLAGLIVGRRLLRQMRWDLALLGLVLIISMLPSANVFRWSFRWLPLIHLTLALCAAQALRYFDVRPARDRALLKLLFSPGGAAVVLVGLTAGAMYVERASWPSEWDSHWPLTVGTLLLACAWATTELLPPRFRRLHLWMPPGITFAALLATYLYIPTNVGVPKYQLDQKLTQEEPLDPDRLYLSVYPPPEHTYRVGLKSGTVGGLVRPGSTSMWSGVRFINGYSPIRPAGVARQFDAAIHGELAPWSGEYFVGSEAGPKGKLERLGVDGIIVARELELAPKPEAEWALVYSSDEGRVYHRRGKPLPRIQSLTSHESLPNERYAAAAVKLIEDSRHRVVADVQVPEGERPALLTFSRPYFPGYRARIGTTRLQVAPYAGAVPSVQIPAGARGRLVLQYRPWWLVAGGATALLCLGVCAGTALLANRRRR